MDNSNLELQLLKKDFEYLKEDAKKKDIILKQAIDKINNKLDEERINIKEAINKIHNKLDDEDRINRIITKKFDEEMLIFKNKYYNFFYVILGGAFVTALTLYKTFIK